ncbi:MAG: hypothetical protein JWP89_3217 [Schlesneria sp.]|nr:hypothetical protein [Schlesneria sp.]
MAFLNEILAIPQKEAWKSSAWDRYLICREKPKPLLPRLRGGTIEFVEMLHLAVEQLREIGGFYRERGCEPDPPRLELTNGFRPFKGGVLLGLPVISPGNKSYYLSVMALWDGECWTITAEAEFEAVSGETISLEMAFSSTADDLYVCRQQIAAAISSLTSFEGQITDLDDSSCKDAK